MKKLMMTAITVTSVAVTSSYAFADSYRNYGQGEMTPGPYVGVYGGYGWTDGDNDAGINVDPDGTDYGLYAGVKINSLLDKTVNRMGVDLTGALEVHYGWSGADETVAGVTFDKEREYGISFRPGLGFFGYDDSIAVNPYAIIGYRRTEYKATAGGVTDDEDFDGFELGLGTELVAYDNVGVRLDYSHVWYGSENGFDPSEDNVRLGMTYHF